MSIKQKKLNPRRVTDEAENCGNLVPVPPARRRV